MNPTPDQKEQRFSEISQDVWSVFSSTKTSQTVLDICKKNGLHIDHYGKVSAIIGDILTGYTSTKNFIPRIVKEVGTSQEVASAIAQEISEQIFKPIRDSLKNIEQKYLGNPVEEVHLSKDDLLRQIENPEHTPLSGRRIGEAVPQRAEIRATADQTSEGDLLKEMDEALKEEAKAPELEKPPASSEPENTPKPTAPQSIFQKKAATPQAIRKEEKTIDPYREPIE